MKDKNTKKNKQKIITEEKKKNKKKTVEVNNIKDVFLEYCTGKMSQQKKPR